MKLHRAEGRQFADGEGPPFGVKPPLEVYMSDDGPSLEQETPDLSAGLDAYRDARALIRLIQCPRCSRVLQTPVTLPCGHSLCRTCLPVPYVRQNISYPNTADRLEGISCPVAGCDGEHSMADVNVDVTFSKVLDSIHSVVLQHSLLQDKTPTSLEEVLDHQQRLAHDPSFPDIPRSAELHGGRILATFVMTEMGDLHYTSQVTYQSLSEDGNDLRLKDEVVFNHIREVTQKELDCLICYNTMYDPVTTGCGHTFCRQCLVRVLDHATQCPACRRKLLIPPSLERQASNARLVSLLLGLCAETYAARGEAVTQEERGEAGELTVPLFVCTLGFPTMPTFLHIFEPRYRLMIRRALERNSQFGMLMYNRSGTSQGDLGATQFMLYGTMLQILNVQMLPDGRSLIEARGLYKFKVKAYGQVDGYTIGSIERVEDVSMAEEEQLEAEETSGARGVDTSMSTEPATSAERGTVDPLDLVAQISRLSTQELLFEGVAFINKMRTNSAPWLHQRILDAYGGPPEDPAYFPYWFASILPIADEEKYTLLQTTSVRQRLKIVVGWIRRIEGQRSYNGNSCIVL